MAWNMFLGFAIGAAAHMPMPRMPGEDAAPFVAATADSMKMEPSPIKPDWIISGQPTARVANHSQSPDKWSQTALWDCTAGTFNWHFDWDETVIILDGDVHVTSQSGQVNTLRVGDVAYFAAGSRAVWQIDDYVRKLAFVRRPLPRGLVALNYWRRLLTGRNTTPI